MTVESQNSQSVGCSCPCSLHGRWQAVRRIRVSFTDQDVCLTVSLEAPRKHKKVVSEKVSGPKKKWVRPDKKDPAEIPVTLLDTDMFEVDSDSDKLAATGASRAKKSAKTSNSQERVNQEDDAEMREAPTPDEALLGQLGPWSLQDYGGQGDCGFRAAVGALLFNQRKPQLSGEDLTREASQIRLLATAHLIKHKETYADGWAIDPLDDVAAWGDSSAPTSFDEYLKLISKRSTWIDEFLISSISERLGLPVVIWFYSPNKQAWLRAVYAPWWQHEVAQSTKKQRPIVLALRDKHYRESVFQEWLWATSDVRESGFLRGAGASDGLSLASQTPSRGSVPRTPVSFKDIQRNRDGVSVGSETPRALSIPSLTPGKSIRVSLVEAPKSTPSRSHAVHRVDTEAGPKPGTRTRIRFKGPYPQVPQFRTLAEISPSELEHTRRVPASVATDSSNTGLPNVTSTSNQDLGSDELPWHCPAAGCNRVFRAPNREALKKKVWSHWRSCHGGPIPAGAGFRPQAEVTDASPNLPRDMHAWTCPVPGCGAGLPHLSKWARELSIEKHRKAYHPKMSRKKCIN